METGNTAESISNEDGKAHSHDRSASHEHNRATGHAHDHHTHDYHTHTDEPMSPEEMERSLFLLGQIALDSKDYESAFDAYASALKLNQSETALLNLGRLYARGLGVRKNYAEAARLFHQAELQGNEQAAQLCGKCMFDFVHDGIKNKTPIDLYAAMAVFVLQVYPEATDQKAEVGRGLMAIGSTCYEKGEHTEAAKAFRAAAEYAGDGYAQYNLALLYNAGSGVAQDNLVALYWLDCAVDNGAADVALAERDAMLHAYRQNLTSEEFQEVMAELAQCCASGTDDIPANPDKAAHWRKLS